MLLGESEVTITWDIPTNQEIGTYRISYYGNWKAIGGSITSFQGKTSPFKVRSLKNYYKKKFNKMSLQEKLQQSLKLNNDIMESKYQIPQQFG